jgi:hypothetical protein
MNFKESDEHPFSGRKVIIEPQLPYMYIPKRDYTEFVDAFEKLFTKRGTECDKVKGYCKWLKPCPIVLNGYTTHGGEKQYQRTYFSVAVGDNKFTKSLELLLEDNLVPGSHLGDAKGDDVCYSPVFIS